MGIVTGAALLAGLAIAAAALVGTASGKGGRSALPPGAVQVAEGTYYLGKKLVGGVEVEGYAFIHRKQAAQGAGPGKGKPGGSCYSLLASGAKWKVAESWQVDPSAAPSVVGSQMASEMTADVGAWESAAGADIFGTGAIDQSYDAVVSTVDGRNGAEFAAISDPGVIAVTYTWGRFGGPAKFRELVEWDMMFDSQDFTWSTSTPADPSSMDFRNIDTHELGHAMGLGHPASTCTEETMYAFASEGETKKRDLNPGDVAGINALY